MSAACCWSLTLLLTFVTINIYGFNCPQTQTHDTHLLCLILQNTDVESKISSNGRDFAVDNYCTWGYREEKIGCNKSSDVTIDYLELEDAQGLNGTLNINYPFPTQLKHIDLEHSQRCTYF